MQTLYVLYDPRCGMCERLRDWLLVQRSWIGLSVIAAGSEKARNLFPGLEKIATSEDNRHGISRWLAQGSPEELAGELRNVPLEPCVVPEGTVSEYLR